MKFTKREPHSWDPRQRTPGSRPVTFDFNSEYLIAPCTNEYWWSSVVITKGACRSCDQASGTARTLQSSDCVFPTDLYVNYLDIALAHTHRTNKRRRRTTTPTPMRTSRGATHIILWLARAHWSLCKLPRDQCSCITQAFCTQQPCNIVRLYVFIIYPHKIHNNFSYYNLFML